VAKQSGLGDNFYVSGVDLSGDTASLGEVGGGHAPIDVTGINKSAFERIGGLRDGRMEWVSHFNDATGQQHATLSSLPTTDRILTYCRGTTLGNPAASIACKQLNYDATRADDGKLTFAVRGEGNAFGLEWGKQLTAGKRTDTTATNGTAVEFGYDGEDFVFLPGTAGNYVSTPDAAALDIVGDIDLRARIAADDWTPAAEDHVIAKYTTTGNQRSYALGIDTTGVLILRWSNDGTAALSASSTAATGFTDGTTHWIRATLDVDNGAAGKTATFYTSDDGTTWTQLGDAVTTGGTTSIFASTAILEIGSSTAGTASIFAGKFFRGQVLSGIAGTAVATPIASASTGTVTDATPLTWTLQGTAYISSHTSYGLQAYLQVFSFTGTSVTVTLQHSHDNGATDAFAAITGAAFTAVSSAPNTERIATTAIEIKRYVRAVTTGTFTSAVFNVNACVNLTSTSF
jgi:hypothetical protein